jgi:hypothetical protein
MPSAREISTTRPQKNQQDSGQQKSEQRGAGMRSAVKDQRAEARVEDEHGHWRPDFFSSQQPERMRTLIRPV